jgi:hypothetical protein
MNVDADIHHSSYRERLIEHLFVGEVLRELWLSGVNQVEVLKSEVDAAGYDVVLECESVVRHIQLKAARRGAKRANVGVHLKLAEKPSGCLVWIFFDPDTLELGPFLWFGGPPGAPLPTISDFRIGKHTKGDSTGHKADRPNIRLVAKGRFNKIDSVAELIERLFGRTLRRRSRPEQVK